MPIFERPPKETLAPSKERWTPIYFEHGRIEVDDSSVKWIGADRTVLRVPVATVSAVLLGPGTSITHAAIKACADCNTPVCWVGDESIRFYAAGITPTHDNSRARLQSRLHASKSRSAEVARRMFKKRFPDVDLEGKSVPELRGMEGHRVRALYKKMGARYGISWKGRQYNPDNWDVADNINKAVSAANAGLYALTASIVCSMGYLPSLGFIHTSGTWPFIFDVADVYKPVTSLPAAFSAVSKHPEAGSSEVLAELKKEIEAKKLLQCIPRDIEEYMR
ncbi:type I-E CRISPR-associated endonuclease Cas1e [Kiritimatiella glycovorans]|uniref:CRISPR-associated endonuclease Cas1 n=1 Tax=Kiritimatiella glycovorans TaxID=1307763 RepID=A0A0G3EIS9_9BACT|nr:type I-E CRISPR-associated endonuclease Cas1e [Kiritimatiella glycovorans]AKJ65307.1 CRISPR-associated endonuclease Cas1 [Kiritimatiella glycovorans]